MGEPRHPILIVVRLQATLCAVTAQEADDVVRAACAVAAARRAPEAGRGLGQAMLLDALTALYSGLQHDAALRSAWSTQNLAAVANALSRGPRPPAAPGVLLDLLRQYAQALCWALYALGTCPEVDTGQYLSDRHTYVLVLLPRPRASAHSSCRRFAAPCLQRAGWIAEKRRCLRCR